MEDGVGPYIFGLNQEITEGEGVEENRNMLYEFLVNSHTVLANTYYKKNYNNSKSLTG
mgnify:CR=1 FL=1